MLRIFEGELKGKKKVTWYMLIEDEDGIGAYDTEIAAKRAGVKWLNSKIEQCKEARKRLTDEILDAT